MQYFEINTTTEDLSAVTFYKKKQIFISPNEAGGRFRFTLAHELGHILLEHGNDRESEFDTRKNMWNPNKKSREYEADEFVAELLMPEEKFKEVWSATKDVPTTAMFFNVSKAAVKKSWRDWGFSMCDFNEDGLKPSSEKRVRQMQPLRVK